MRKIVILASALSVIGVGAAAATELFTASSQNDAPVPSAHFAAPIDRTATADVNAGPRAPVGFSAAQDFGPSDRDDLPAPRFQTAGEADRNVVTSGTGIVKTYQGYNASDDFGPS